MDEAQVQELAEKLGSEVNDKIKGLNEDFNKKFEKLEGQFKDNGRISEDDLKEFKGLSAVIKGLEEKHGEQISKLATRLNAAETVGGAFGGQSKADYRELIKKGLEEKLTGGFGRGISGSTNFELKEGQAAMHFKAVGDMTNANLTGGYASRDIRPAIISNPYRKIRVRSLLPVGSTSSPVVEYLKHTGGEGGVGFQTAEGAAKPKVDFDFQMVSQTLRTIAVFARVSKQMLDDIPRLSSFISNQLTEQWFDFEDNQIINGDGTGQNFDGILKNATDYVAGYGGTKTVFQHLVGAIAQLETNNFDANGILIHPMDFVNLLTYKTTTGEFDHPGLVYGADNILRLYGTPIVKNSAIGQGHAIVGDWTKAELIVRDGLQFDLSYDDADNFTKNQVTLRLEARELLAIYMGHAFRDVNLNEIAS
jgi:HK97 family phage major capsid protein